MRKIYNEENTAYNTYIQQQLEKLIYRLLSKSLNAEIISADSMQIYKYMDIGSAKVTKEEMDGVVHYMIDEVTPDVPFSVSEFQMRSEKYIEEIKKGKSVLITGGTGLYLNSLYTIWTLQNQMRIIK